MLSNKLIDLIKNKLEVRIELMRVLEKNEGQILYMLKKEHPGLLHFKAVKIYEKHGIPEAEWYREE